MSQIFEEGKIKGSIDIISLDKIKILTKQIKKCICRVDGMKTGTGFFCKINYENKLTPVLMTNYHILSPDYYEYKQKITLSFDKNRILINIKQNIILYSSPNYEYDIIIIKLDELQNEITNYLEIDTQIFSKQSEETYKDESIYLLHYPNGTKPSISFGYGFKQYNEYQMQHLCNSEISSSGGPILSLATNKIIGIHRGLITNQNEILINAGSFLKFPLNELNDNNQAKNDLIKGISKMEIKNNNIENKNKIYNKYNNLKKDNNRNEAKLKNLSPEYKKVIFKTTSQYNKEIYIEPNKTINELIKLFFKEMNKPELFNDNDIAFLCNGSRLNKNSKISVSELFFLTGLINIEVPLIIVRDTNNKLRT